MVAEQFEKKHSTEKIPLILGVVTSHNYCTVPVWPLHGFENIRKYEANVRPFWAFRAHSKEHILKTKFAFLFSANGKEHCVKI